MNSKQHSNPGMMWTVFPDIDAHDMDTEVGNWNAFVGYMEWPAEFPSKKACPLIKLAQFSSEKSPAGSYRYDAAVGPVYGVEVDYDDGVISPAEAARRLEEAGVEALVVTTASHTAGKPRWRAFAPLAEAVSPDQRHGLVGLLNGALGGIVAKESFTLSQAFYFGRVKGCEYEAHRSRGLPIDELSLFIEPVFPKSANRAPAVAANDNEQALLDMPPPRQGASAQEVGDMLALLPNNLSYLDWFVVGAAVHHETDGEGFDIWHEWCRNCSGYTGEPDCRKKWNSMGRRDKPPYATLETTVAPMLRESLTSLRASAEAAATKLRTLAPDQVARLWPQLAIGVDAQVKQRVLEEVVRLTGLKINTLKRTLGDATQARRTAAREAANEQRIRQREVVRYRPEDTAQQAGDIDERIAGCAAAGEYVNYGGTLAYIASKPQPFSHQVDDQSAAPPETVQIVLHDDVTLRALIEGHFAFTTEGSMGDKLIGVPELLIDMCLRKREHRAPIVTGLASHPIVLANGAILSREGLDRASGLYLSNVPPCGATAYSQDEARTALRRLRDLFEGFEFASQLDADVAMAALFTGVERRAIDMAPAFAVLANVQSSGKTTLLRVAHVVITGRDMPASTFPSQEEEMQKRLLATLLRGPAMVCFDNVADGFTFRSPSIAAAITSSVMSQRILGLSKDADVSTRTLLCMTGNNISFGVDEVSRWMVSPGAEKLAARGASLQAS